MSRKTKSLALSLFLSSVSYGAEQKNPVINAPSQSQQGLKTKDANISQLMDVYQRLPSPDAFPKQLGTPVVSFADKMASDQHLSETIAMLQNGNVDVFLTGVYKKFAPALTKLSQDEIAEKKINPQDYEIAQNQFRDAYEATKNGDELKGDGKFPESVSRYGNFNTAAKDFVILENNLKDPEFASRVINLIKQAYLFDSSKEGSALPTNPEKKTVYQIEDAKTGDIVTANPNNIALIMADAVKPGGGILTGASAQEEQTLRAAKDVQMALFTIAPMVYPLQTYQALTIGNYVFAAMVDNQTNPQKNNAPESAADYVKTVVLKLDSLLSAAVLQSQNLKDDSQKVLILGAAGCGVFNNDPVLVSKIFFDLLKTKYNGYFDKVIFALYTKDYKGLPSPVGSKNFDVFSETLKPLTNQ